MKTLVLNVDGMHCKSCGMLIKDALDDLGVDKTEVSGDHKKVRITFNESKINLDAIKKIIEREGYKVEW